MSSRHAPFIRRIGQQAFAALWGAEDSYMYKVSESMRLSVDADQYGRLLATKVSAAGDSASGRADSGNQISRTFARGRGSKSLSGLITEVRKLDGLTLKLTVLSFDPVANALIDR